MHQEVSTERVAHTHLRERTPVANVCSSCSSTVAAPLAEPRTAKTSSRLRVRWEPFSPLLVRGQGAVDASAPPAVVGPTPCSTVAGAARLQLCSIAVPSSLNAPQ